MIFTLFGILITSIAVSPTFGENESIVVSTDKSSYSENDVISIYGEIKYIALGDQISLIVQAPNGNIVQLDQMTVESDKKFNAEINPNGPYWKTPGMYKITITQNENNQATAYFEFTGITSPSVNEEAVAEESEAVAEESEAVAEESEAVAEEGTVEEAVAEESEVTIIDSIITATSITIQDSTDLISYEITNGKVINSIPDLDAVSLLLILNQLMTVQLH